MESTKYTNRPAGRAVEPKIEELKRNMLGHMGLKYCGPRDLELSWSVEIAKLRRTKEKTAGHK